MKAIWGLAWSGALFAAGAAAGQPEGPDARRTLAVDAVELARGREVAGEPGVRVEHAGFVYVFANHENRAAFLRDPARYEIRLGGACARMGPLSGMGTGKIWAMHEGGLYVFASESCRETFLAHADRLLERDDPMLEGAWVTPEAMGAGRDWISRAVDAVGGAERLDAVRTLTGSRREESVHNGVVYVHDTTRIHRFPDDYAEVDAWNDDWWSHAVRGQDAFFFGSDGELREMRAEQRRAVERLRDRSLHAVLRARTRADFFSCEMPRAEGDPEDIVRVATWWNGTRVDLALDRATGRAVSMAFTGRGPALTLGRIERTFTEFVEVGGLTLPSGWTATFDGAAREALTERGWVWTLDAEPPVGVMDRPR